MVIGQLVLVRLPSTNRKKKHQLGKSIYPYSGQVVGIVSKKTKNRYKIKWGAVPGNNELSGQESKKIFERQWLLPVTKEHVEVVVQHYKNADSWNSYELKLYNDQTVTEVFRQRTTEDGFLELLCEVTNKKKPVWKPVTLVGETDAYKRFEYQKVYFFY